MRPPSGAGARAFGPLATFDGAETWVDHPYKAGVVLMGDAAPPVIRHGDRDSR